MGEEDVARQLLDRAMTLRRSKIRKKWAEIAELAGMKYQSLHRLRTNPEIGITDLAAAGVEDAMEWNRGTVAAIMTGKVTPEQAADLPRVNSSPAHPGRTLIDPIASPMEEINAFIADVRGVEGDDVADELWESIVKVRALAAHRRRHTVTSGDHEES